MFTAQHNTTSPFYLFVNCFDLFTLFNMTSINKRHDLGKIRFSPCLNIFTWNISGDFVKSFLWSVRKKPSGYDWKKLDARSMSYKSLLNLYKIRKEVKHAGCPWHYGVFITLWQTLIFLHHLDLRAHGSMCRHLRKISLLLLVYPHNKLSIWYHALLKTIHS